MIHFLYEKDWSWSETIVWILAFTIIFTCLRALAKAIGGEYGRAWFNVLYDLGGVALMVGGLMHGGFSWWYSIGLLLFSLILIADVNTVNELA